MNNHIKLTSREYTITLSDQNLQTVIAYDLVESIKSAVYELEGIDIIIYHDQRKAFIIDILDENLDPKLVYSKITKVIASHKLTASA